LIICKGFQSQSIKCSFTGGGGTLFLFSIESAFRQIENKIMKGV